VEGVLFNRCCPHPIPLSTPFHSFPTTIQEKDTRDQEGGCCGSSKETFKGGRREGCVSGPGRDGGKEEVTDPPFPSYAGEMGEGAADQ